MNEVTARLLLQVGVGGTLAIIILIVVFKYGFPALKTRKNGVRCIHLPEVRTALNKNLSTHEATMRLEGKIDGLKEDSTVQTTHLKLISTEAKEHTRLLQILVNK